MARECAVYGFGCEALTRVAWWRAGACYRLFGEVGKSEEIGLKFLTME
jgi:hypothetical protein